MRAVALPDDDWEDDPLHFVHELSICSLMIRAETSFEHIGLVKLLIQQLVGFRREESDAPCHLHIVDEDEKRMGRLLKKTKHT